MTRQPTVGEVGERAMLARFARAAAAAPPAVVGPGDDAAVVEPGATVLGVDTAVQDRHFRLEWSDPRQIGARAVVAAAADVAAMGARTTGILIALAAPPSTPADLVEAINAGAVAQAVGLGASVLGGDLVEAGEIAVSITAVGVLDGVAPVLLSGARVGDVLAVSGPLGASAAGFAVLSGSGERGGAADAVVAAFCCPAPDLAQGPIAARAGAHALTDVSDGLVAELGLMCAAAGVAVAVDSAALPVTDAVRDVAADLGHDPVEWALGGGEDHELLGAFAAVGDVPAGWTVIGRVTDAGPASPPVLVDGRPTRVQGWRSV
ncbi:MAG: thiamine-phosphate kinase [Gordonia sp. (in: high G+C Gram-positive bacteria)]|uniref:thiamine-phosphate kinase n=1 Tax=Gordonia sp. (in: high G+C Gram-positive bacteria) TaxID=84139 RepID=UPI0039E69057